MPKIKQPPLNSYTFTKRVPFCASCLFLGNVEEEKRLPNIMTGPHIGVVREPKALAVLIILATECTRPLLGLIPFSFAACPAPHRTSSPAVRYRRLASLTFATYVRV